MNNIHVELMLKIADLAQKPSPIPLTQTICILPVNTSVIFFIYSESNFNLGFSGNPDSGQQTL